MYIDNHAGMTKQAGTGAEATSPIEKGMQGLDLHHEFLPTTERLIAVTSYGFRSSSMTVNPPVLKGQILHFFV